MKPSTKNQKFTAEPRRRRRRRPNKRIDPRLKKKLDTCVPLSSLLQSHIKPDLAIHKNPAMSSR
jgi:hypothetical protein